MQKDKIKKDIILVHSIYQCKKCKTDLPFGYKHEDFIHKGTKERYNLDPKKEYLMAQCPKCCSTYIKEETE